MASFVIRRQPQDERKFLLNIALRRLDFGFVQTLFNPHGFACQASRTPTLRVVPGLTAAADRAASVVKEPSQLMSVSDIQDHFCAPEAAFSEVALCSVAFLSPRAPLLRIHWPQATVLSLLPHQRGQVVRGLFRAGYCHPPTSELSKTERGPISTSGPSIFSMSPKCSMLPNQAISSDKSIRFSPLAAARPLTIRSWPDALNVKAPKRPPTFRLQGNVSCRFRLRALDRSFTSNTSLDG